MAKKILIVTSYPELGSVHSSKTVGVASYTKQWLQGIKKNFPTAQVRVLAERFGMESSYLEDDIQVQRMWRRGSLLDLFKVWKNLLTSDVKVVALSFEAYMFGTLFLGIVALSLFLTLKIAGKRVILVMHQMPQELSFVNGLRKLVTKVGILFLKGILSQMNTVIVFEEVLKNRIGKNAVFVPHFVPEVKRVDQNLARKLLGLPRDKKIIMYFGYIAPYKGIERLIELWPEPSDSQLVIAGGMNPNHSDREEIRSLVSGVVASARKKNLVTTGFVPEDQLPLYFSACDAVILPYVEFMSSSGPLSLAWAYEKPVILSHALRDYLKSKDFSDGLAKSKLIEKSLFYLNSSNDLDRVIQGIEEQDNKFRSWSSYMRDARSIRVVSTLTSAIFWSEQE